MQFITNVVFLTLWSTNNLKGIKNIYNLKLMLYNYDLKRTFRHIIYVKIGQIIKVHKKLASRIILSTEGYRLNWWFLRYYFQRLNS